MEEEDRSGDHITAELGIGRKSDALSPIFMGKLPPVPKDGSREENLWGSRRKRRGIGKLGSLGGQAFCMPNRWGKTCGACSNRMQRGTELKTAQRNTGML